MTCLASVIIPTFNRRELLRLTLKSLAHQNSRGIAFEVIVVDDGSTDGSASLVDRFNGQLNISVVRQDHRGFRVARARNLGLERARGEIVIFADSGMVLGGDFVASHLAAHLGQAPLVAAIGYVHGYDFGDVSDPAVAMFELADIDVSKPTMSKEQHGPDIRERLYIAVDDRVDSLPAPWSLFWTTNVSVSRGLLCEVGGFDEDFVSWGMEDVECGYRLWQKGARFVLSRKAAGIHCPHARDKAANMISHAKNRELFHRKHPTVETEAFLASDPLRFNLELARYYAHAQGRRALWQHMGMTAIPNDLRDLAHVGEVVFGFQDGALLQACASRAGIDADQRSVDAALLRHPNRDLRVQLGVRTNFADHAFHHCLLGASTLFIPKNWHLAMVTEARRIATRVFALRFQADRSSRGHRPGHLLRVQFLWATV